VIALTLVIKKEIDMTMKNALSVVAAVAAAMFAQATFAQASAPASRADVKAQTAADIKDKKLIPPSEGAAPTDKPAAKSTLTKEERKAQTRADIKDKKLIPASEGGEPAKK